MSHMTRVHLVVSIHSDAVCCVFPHAQIPMIVLYVFGIPIVAFIVLRNNRTELHDIETRRKYSFLYAVRSIHSQSIILSWNSNSVYCCLTAEITIVSLLNFPLLNFPCVSYSLSINRVTASAVPTRKTAMKRAGTIGSWSSCRERLQSSLFRYACATRISDAEYCLLDF